MSEQLEKQRSSVQDKFNDLLDVIEQGKINFSKNYNPVGALESAFTQILNLTFKHNNNSYNVSDYVTPDSIYNCLYKMLVDNLYAEKKHCSFIKRGNTLNYQVDYNGTIELAKRGGLKEVFPHVVYTLDEFEYETNEQGLTKLLKHKSNLGNIDFNNIIGAYASVILHDGTQYIEVMSMAQIQQAWEQGTSKGNSDAHKKFKDQMCMKTVITRACKPYARSGGVELIEEYQPTDFETGVKEEIETNSAKTKVDFNPEDEDLPDWAKN